LEKAEGVVVIENKVTIRDIAKYAGVGTTTVSRVLNAHPYVSEEKRQRVMDAIDALNYRPSQSARLLRGSPSGLIGFLTDDVATTPYAVDIIRGAQEVAWQHNMVLLIADSGNNRDSTEAAVEVFLEREVQGIVYATMYHREVTLPDSLAGTPTVLADCFLADYSVPSVVPDEFDGGYNATKHLIECGHRRIGFINLWEVRGGVAPPLPAIHGRLLGYRHALEEFGIPFDESLIRFTDQSPSANYTHAKDLLQVDNPPTAIFCGNDRTAMSCYGALSDMGLRIPDDIAVVGFDNILDITEGLFPTLTSIQLPHYEMGIWAVEYLLEHIHDQTKMKPIQHKVSCPLVIRDSV